MADESRVQLQAYNKFLSRIDLTDRLRQAFNSRRPLVQWSGLQCLCQDSSARSVLALMYTRRDLHAYRRAPGDKRFHQTRAHLKKQTRQMFTADDKGGYVTVCPSVRPSVCLSVGQLGLQAEKSAKCNDGTLWSGRVLSARLSTYMYISGVKSLPCIGVIGEACGRAWGLSPQTLDHG